MHYPPIFVAALLLSATLSGLIRDFARKQGWVIASTSQRHIHQTPIPRIGGVAVLVATFAVMIAWAALSHWLPFDFPRGTLLRLVGPTLLIFGIGLIDDFKPLSPHLKITFEAVAAAWLFLDGFGVTRFQLLFGDRYLSAGVGFVFTVVWLVLITNAFNLLDGLDGLAAGSAIFSSIVIFVVSVHTENSLTAVVTAALAGAISGFLGYNFNPATIFMGDCGSLVIGFLLGALSLISSAKAPTAVAVGIPFIAFGLPILDTLIAILRRFLNRRPLFSADGEHIHHKLLKHGLSHRQAVVVLYGASAAFGLVSLSLLSTSLTLVAVALTIVGVSVVFGLQRLGYREMDEIWRVARSTWQQKTIISNNLAIWRATDHLATATTFQEVSCILKAAFQETDYDGFEYSFTPKAAFREENYGKLPTIAHVWRKESRNGAVGWTLQLDLVSRNGQVCGRFAASRMYSSRSSYRGTIDCLTSEFVTALAASLERIADEQLASSPSTLSFPKRMPTVADAA